MDFDFTSETITTDQTTVLTINSTGAVTLSSGTTAQRPGTPVAGMLRYNSSNAQPEGYIGTQWSNIIHSGLFTAAGDILYGTASNAVTRLGVGTLGQVLTSTGTAPSWSNSIGTAYTAIVTPNTLVSGNLYSANINHALGTNNVVISVYDNSTEAYIIPHALVQTDTNNLLITVVGNTRTYRVVIIANGSSIQAGGSTPSSIVVQNQGVNLSGGPFTIVNLASGLTATNTGAGVATITPSNTVIKQFTFYAASLDNPNNSDWVVNSLAPVVADPTYPSFTVRQFSTSTEGGVGSFITVPSNATNVTISFKGRPQTAPGTSATIVPKLYVRSIPTNAAIGAWSAAYTLASQTVPTNADFQYYTIAAATLTTYGMAASGLYLIEFTLGTTGTLTGNWLMTELSISFT